MPRLLASGDGTLNRTDDFIPAAIDSFWVQASSNPTLVPVPAASKYVLYSFPDGNYGVKYGLNSDVVAALPTGSGLTTDIDEWNPAQRVLSPSITHLSIIAPAGHDGMVTFYS